MIVLDDLVADPDNNKGYIDKLLVDLGHRPFEEARRVLITHAEDILQDISTRCPRAFEFTIGKTGADKDARCKCKSFDNMDASKWNHKGINDRWKKSYLKAGYNALIVLCAVTFDHLPSLRPNTEKQKWQNRKDNTEIEEQQHGPHDALPTSSNDVIYQRNGIIPRVVDNHESIGGMTSKGDKSKSVFAGETYSKMFPGIIDDPQHVFICDMNSQKYGYGSFNDVTRDVTGSNVVNVDHCYHEIHGENKGIKDKFKPDSCQRVGNFVPMTENSSEIGANLSWNAGSNVHPSGASLNNNSRVKQGPWDRNIITSAYETLNDNTLEEMFEDDSMAKAPRQGIFDQHGYAIALEQQLIHHFTFGKQDKRILNSSLTTGGGEFSKTEAGIVYLAIRFKEPDRVAL